MDDAEDALFRANEEEEEHFHEVSVGILLPTILSFSAQEFLFRFTYLISWRSRISWCVHGFVRRSYRKLEDFLN